MLFSPTSFVLGLAAAWLVPVAARVGRSLAVEATAVGFAVFDDVRRVVAEQLETLEDIAAEARARRDELITRVNGSGSEDLADEADDNIVDEAIPSQRARRPSCAPLRVRSHVMAAAPDEAILLRVVHDIPGRLRVRLSPAVGAESVADAAARLDGIVECRWSPLTRGLLVRYRPEVQSPDVIVAEIARHVAPGEAPEAVSAAALPRPTTFGDAVKVTVAAIDDRLRTASYGQVGLSGLVTFALAGWGMAEIVRGRAAPLVWSSAFWYAHGLFRDYHVPPTRDA